MCMPTRVADTGSRISRKSPCLVQIVLRDWIPTVEIFGLIGNRIRPTYHATCSPNAN
jgi:hypothetical protein